jgi:formylglycine-generating enzyme required for sulfatase activity
LNRAPNALHNRNTLRLVLSDEVVVKTIVIDNKMAFNMRMVDGGTFTMGDDSSDNTSPAHQVTLSDYYIGQTEVTQTLWKAVMGTNPSDQNDDSYKPVGNVSWDDAQLFVEKLSNKTGLNFRLPTEAEWEYAAMGGKLSQGYKYPGSDNIDDVAWYGVNSDNKLHVVGTKMPNELGIYDMSGNVWEWVSDWYGNYSAQKQINPQGPSSGTGRVLRSGSYVTQAAYRCAIKYRQSRKADYPDVHIGFRIVLDTTVRNCYTFTQEHWDAAISLWGHSGRGHASSDQSCIQGTIVHGVRLKVAKTGSLNVYKVHR